MSTYTKTSKYSNLSRKEAQEELDRLNNAVSALQAHLDTLPKNNHPPVLLEGMLFRLIADDVQEGVLFIYVSKSVGSDGLVSISTGERWAHSSTFGDAGPESFEYLGYAKDLLILKPRLTVSQSFAAYEHFTKTPGNAAAMHSTLEAFLSGKFN